MAYARITTDPAIMMGKPCVKGTRITVELLELDRTSNASEAGRLAEVVSIHAEKLVGNLVVIEPSRIRIRPRAR